MTAVDTEKRVAPRYPAAEVPAITGVRLSTAGDVSLVDVSATGALVKSRRRLLPGSMVTVSFDRDGLQFSVKSRVARCAVADIDAKGMSYHIGIAFNTPVQGLPAATQTTVSAAPPPPPPPLAEALTSSRSLNRW